MRNGRGMVAAALAAMLVLAACTSSETTQTPTTPAAGGATDSASEGGTPDNGTFVVAIDSDPGQLNPAITTSGGTHTASELLYNGLVRVNAQLEVEPDLAQDWEITDDGATYTFNLRDDVVWHDGEPFTSADVKFSFDEVLLKFHSRTSASLGGALESIETPDETTVVFRFSQPYAPLLQQLDVTEAPIVAQHIYEGTDPETADANLEPVGTGPYTFVSYTPDSEIRLARNEDYFRGAPAFEEVVERIIPEEQNQLLAFEQGEVDWLWGVPGPELERLQGDPDVKTLETSKNPGGGNCIMTLSYNLDRPTLQDQRVRRAIALGIDRQPMLDNVLFGLGRVAQAPISSGIGFAHGTNLDMPGFDAQQAATLLDEAGWVRDGDATRTAQGIDGVDDGTPLNLNVLLFPTFTRYGELMRQQLGEIGVDLEVVPMEPPALAERVFTERDFDTNVISYCNQSDPEVGVRRMYISSNIKPIPFSNSSGYRNEQIDQLFDDARAEVDTEARGQIYQQIQEILVDELPYYWLVETDAVRAYHANCQNFLPFGHFLADASCTS